MFIFKISVLVTLPLLLAAAPIEDTEGGIKIPLFRRGTLVDGEGHDIPERVQSHIARAVRKYETRPHGGQALKTRNEEDVEKRALPIGSVPFSTEDEVVWVADVKFGTKTFKMQLTTGSSDSWVAGSKCSTCPKGPAYEISPNPSPNTNQITMFDLFYHDRSKVQGTIVKDDLSIGGLKISAHPMGIANKLIGAFNPHINGMLGFGLPALSKFGQLTIMQNLKQKNQIPKEIFAYQLASKYCKPELTLGSYNKQRFIGNIATVKVVDESGFWTVPMDGIFYNGNSIVGQTQVTIDPSVDYVLAPFDIVKTLHDAIPDTALAPQEYGYGRYTVPCTKVPTIALRFKGQSFTFHKFTSGAVRGTDNCLTNIISFPRSSEVTTTVVGSMFLSGVYMIHDASNPDEPTVGFAEPNTC